MKIGIIKEHKIPGDQRVVLTPKQAQWINEHTIHEVLIQSYGERCYSDYEYQDAGVRVVENVDDCDVLVGVKEIPIPYLTPMKMMMFFSHTIKEQPYNREMLRAIVDKHIQLIDYEIITDEMGKRLIAFGRFAGMVGAYNGVMTYGSRTGWFALPRMRSFKNYKEAKQLFSRIDWPPMRIVLTGRGRVGQGAAEVLKDMGIHEISVMDMDKYHDNAVFVQLDSEDYCMAKDGSSFDKTEYYAYPDRYTKDFKKFYTWADIMINGIYWDYRAPAFFTIDDMSSEDFRIQVIADVTCDIAPESSIPSTIRPSTIEEPIYGFDPKSEQEIDPFDPDGIDVMAVDNLPNELPRDASHAFGSMFIEHVLPELGKSKSNLLDRATICKEGRLTEQYSYLSSFVGV